MNEQTPITESKAIDDSFIEMSHTETDKKEQTNEKLNDSNFNTDATIKSNVHSVVKKSGNGRLKAIVGFIVFAIIVYIFINGGLFGSSYYVAKLPSYNAATVKVDGYMHKSRSCCKKVADANGAEVIRVKPDQSARTNSYGQTIRYENCFNYCPLCCY